MLLSGPALLGPVSLLVRCPPPHPHPGPGHSSDLRRSSLGWFLFSRFLSMRSESSCLRTSVAYSRRPCRPVMMSEATLPRSRMEKLRCSSRVRMKVSKNTLLLMSWAKSFRAFSTCCCPFPCTWVGVMACPQSTAPGLPARLFPRVFAGDDTSSSTASMTPASTPPTEMQEWPASEVYSLL